MTKAEDVTTPTMTSMNSAGHSKPWSMAGQAMRWRLRRLKQFVRVRWLSWGRKEVEVSGVRIPLFDYISDTVREAMFDGGYESAELRTIAHQLDGDDVVLEVGTGIGLISTYCAKRIGAERVFTFEGNPELEPLIRQVYQLNSVAPTLQIGILGRNEGSTTFFVHEDFWSSSTVKRRATGRQVTVPQLNLNATLARIRPSFLIIDIEGGESELFEFIDLSGIRKISIELHDSVIGVRRVQEIIEKLKREGFDIDWAHSSSIEGYKQELFLRRMRASTVGSLGRSQIGRTDA